MTATFVQKESLIKKEMTRMSKSFSGKGPEFTEVKIYQNFVFIKLVGALTPIEENLLKTGEGFEIVKQIRDELILGRTERYAPILEEIVEAKVEKVNYMMDEKNNTIFIFVLFSELIR